VPELRRRDELELELQTAIGMPLIATKGYAAPETGAAYARAHELCERLSCSEQQLFPILYGQWAYHSARGKWSKGRRLAEDFLAHAHRILGLTLAHLGDLRVGREQIEQALALYDPERHRFLAFRFGQDQRIAGLAYLSVILGLSGFRIGRRRRSTARWKRPERSIILTAEATRWFWGAATLAHLRRDAPPFGGTRTP
jgi:predicted ATPase